MRTAVIEGSSQEPVIALSFTPNDVFPHDIELPSYPKPVSSVWSKYQRPQMPRHPRTIGDWVRALPSRKWDRERKVWIVTQPGPDIERVLTEAGFDIDYGIAEGHIRSLSQLARPKVTLDPLDPAMCWVHLRFADFATVESWLPAYNEWDAKKNAWRCTTADITASDDRLPLSRAVMDESGRQASRPSFRFGSASEKDISALACSTGDANRPGTPPLWRAKRELYGYQKSGALAVASGHSLLADEPGLGKTSTAISAHATVGTRRLVVVCPPVVLSNWERELSIAGYSEPDAEEGLRTCLVRPGRKVPDFPDAGVVIVADSLVGARPELVGKIIDWHPDGLIVDEAHREKGLMSKRSLAVRRIAHNTSGLRIPITGTPVVKTPQDLAPLLDISGHIGPVFNGLSAFMSVYCRKDRMRGWVPRMKSLPALRDVLDAHVWVRRNTDDVIDLPDLIRLPMIVDINLTAFRRTHGEVIDQVVEWMDEMVEARNRATGGHSDELTSRMLDDIQDRSFFLVSKLRKTAGLSKVPVAKDWITDFLDSNPANDDGTYDRPLVVWTHHREVTEAMILAASELGVPVASIWGETQQSKVPQIVDRFQEGKIAVLVAAMKAAGVGVTLTRGRDALFVETDWTPDTIQQAQNRQRRIGQTHRMVATTLVARDTLDERIQEVLANTSKIVNPLVGGDNDMSVIDTDGNDHAVRAIIDSIIAAAMDKRRRRRR